MVVFTGRLEVFKSKEGYPLSVLKGFKDNKVIGKVFIDTKVDLKMTEGKTYTIQVNKGYLNVNHIETEEKSFDKLSLSIVDYELVSVFPEEKKTTKKSKKVVEDDNPF